MSRKRVLQWLDSFNYLEKLEEYISIPSRSNNPEEVKEAARFATYLLREIGFQNVIQTPTSGNPVIIAELKKLSGHKPTVLFYGHYDVQPEGDRTQWDSEPFTPSIRNGKLFGRGAADNKGQHYAHLLAVQYLMEHNPEVLDNVRVRVILDGDEERGSGPLPEVMQRYKEMLEADIVYASDGPSLLKDKPTIVGAVRGIVDLQITVKTSEVDLHSGNFGGVARSAPLELLHLLTSMVNEEGEVLVEGYYDKVRDPEEVEEEAIKKLGTIYSEIIEERNICSVNGDIPRLNQLLPTLNINGIQAGDVGEKRRTVIPSSATASIDCRLVPDMKPDEIVAIITQHIDKWKKERRVEVTIKPGHSMNPTRSSLSSPWYKIIEEAARTGFGTEPVAVPRLGGSLPLSAFPEVLGVPVILVPYALPDENNHAPNENLDLTYFKSGVATSASLLQLIAEKS